MDTTVIVALPEEDDKVNKVSSEVAHLTLCFLGPTADLDLETIVEFVRHAASQLSPFWLETDYRGELGPDNADVLFFKKDSYCFPRISSFRGHLLQNEAIEKAYLAQDQYPEWTPHLTLGYPATPAHEIDSEYPKIHGVHFDRIAVWDADNSGLEFRLKYADDALVEASMGHMSTSERGALAASAIFAGEQKIEHYGVKGMQWGVTTRDRAHMAAPKPVEVTQKKPGKFAKAEGGQNHPLHPEAKASLEVRQKAKASTTDSLSNQELRTAVQRMQLEQQYSQLAYQSDRRSRGARFVAGLLGQRKTGGKIKFEDLDEKHGAKVGQAIKKAAKNPDVRRAAIKTAVKAGVV